MDYKDLIVNIINIFQRKQIGFGKVKLIKIAYLVELEYFRRNRERLTDAEWIYYKYGPYPTNYKDYLDHDLIVLGDAEPNGFQSINLKEFALVPAISESINRMIQNLISKYGTLDLDQLLDYVYYETEPMMTVENRGEHLDFDVVLPKEYYQIKKFKNLDQVKKKLKRKYKGKMQDACKL